MYVKRSLLFHCLFNSFGIVRTQSDSQIPVWHNRGSHSVIRKYIELPGGYSWPPRSNELTLSHHARSFSCHSRANRTASGLRDAILKVIQNIYTAFVLVFRSSFWQLYNRYAEK